MRKLLIAALTACLGATCTVTAPAAETQAGNESVVRTAQAFLDTLSDDQRRHVVYDYGDLQQRARWSNFPAAMSPRGGMSLAQMTPAQRGSALSLMKLVLSPMGYEKIEQIRLADDDFAANGSKRGPPRGNGPPSGAGGPPPPGAGGPDHPGSHPPLGNGPLFGQNLYFISMLGTPSTVSPWILQFGGHHLALNIAMAGREGVMTPSLTGAQPATFKLNGKTIRPLGRESDQAATLLQSLDAQQRQQAVLPYRVADLVLGPGQDGKQITPEGLQVARMSDRQKLLVLGLMSEWAGMMNEASAQARMAQLKSELNQSWFAWSGPTDVAPGTNITSYYRIQGPHVVIEYAPQADEPGNHVHTIYRDPTRDYGLPAAAERR